jgi:hypothetical protein
MLVAIVEVEVESHLIGVELEPHRVGVEAESHQFHPPPLAPTPAASPRLDSSHHRLG